MYVIYYMHQKTPWWNHPRYFIQLDIIRLCLIDVLGRHE
jgi:hypothetical protein